MKKSKKDKSLTEEADFLLVYIFPFSWIGFAT